MNLATRISILLILVCFSNMVKADWPVGKKRLVLSPSYNYSSTSSYFDQDGKVRNAVNGGQFTSKGFGLYGATGVSRRVDLFFSVPMSFINSSDIFSEQTKTGVGDVMVGQVDGLIGRERGVKLPWVQCGRQQGSESRSRDEHLKVPSNATLSTLAWE